MLICSIPRYGKIGIHTVAGKERLERCIQTLINLEILVLWARSEIFGSAYDSFKELWRIGILE